MKCQYFKTFSVYAFQFYGLFVAYKFYFCIFLYIKKLLDRLTFVTFCLRLFGHSEPCLGFKHILIFNMKAYVIIDEMIHDHFLQIRMDL